MCSVTKRALWVNKMTISRREKHREYEQRKLCFFLDNQMKCRRETPKYGIGNALAKPAVPSLESQVKLAMPSLESRLNRVRAEKS